MYFANRHIVATLARGLQHRRGRSSAAPTSARAMASKRLSGKQAEGGKVKPAAGAAEGDGKNQEAELRKQMSAMATGLKVVTKDAEVNQARSEVSALYSRLPRFHPEKQVLLQKWLADKNCRWVNSYKAERFNEDTCIKKAVSGYGTLCPFP